MRWLVCCLVAAVLMLPGHAPAQDLPPRPVRLLVAYAPGGGTDILARVIGEAMAEDLGRAVVIDNRPGAGSQIASEIVARAPADGSTLLMATIAHSINPGLYGKLPYDSIRDFAPVSLVASVPLILLVSPQLGVSSVEELIALAKSKPGKLNNAIATGSLPHLAGEMFKRMAGVDIVPVPFRGNSPAYPDLIAGRVQMMFDALSSGLPQVNAGALKGLAITSAQRSPAAPNIPTLAEAGLPGFEADAWYGILAPAGTPRPVIDKLNASIRKAVARPAVQEKLATLGYTVRTNSPDEFLDFIKSETDKWGKVVTESGAKPE